MAGTVICYNYMVRRGADILTETFFPDVKIIMRTNLTTQHKEVFWSAHPNVQRPIKPFFWPKVVQDECVQQLTQNYLGTNIFLVQKIEGSFTYKLFRR